MPRMPVSETPAPRVPIGEAIRDTTIAAGTGSVEGSVAPAASNGVVRTNDVGGPAGRPEAIQMARAAKSPEVIMAEAAVRLQRAEKYAELVNSNETWQWNEIGKKIKPSEQEAIRKLARELELVPTVPVDKVTRFADFSKFAVEDIPLPKELWNATDAVQFRALDKAIGGRPKGYTWHHHQDPGRMQLVPFGIHNSTYHRGGREVWALGPRQ